MVSTQIFSFALCLVVATILSASGAPTSGSQSNTTNKTTNVISSKTPDSVFDVISIVSNKTAEKPTTGTGKSEKPAISTETKAQKSAGAAKDQDKGKLKEDQEKDKEYYTKSQSNQSQMKAEMNFMPFEYGGYEPSMQGGYGYGYNSMSGGY